MRRISLAALTLALTVGFSPLAAAQDALVKSARQFSQQGQHDTAISMLRGALAQQPANAELKLELAAALGMKLDAMRAELARLDSEIRLLRGPQPGPSWTYTPAPPRVAAVMIPGSTMSPVRVGGSIAQPIKLKDVKPMYPPEAQAARVSGIVIIEALIDTNGDVASATVLRGQPLLNDAAVEAVKQWKYSQTLLNGQPVPVIMTVTVTFTVQ